MLCAKSPKGLRSLLRLGDCLPRCCHSSKRFNFDCIRFVVALVFGYPFPRMFAQLFDKFTGSPSQDPLPPALTSQQPSIPASLACAFGRFSQSSGGPEKGKGLTIQVFMSVSRKQPTECLPLASSWQWFLFPRLFLHPPSKRMQLSLKMFSVVSQRAHFIYNSPALILFWSLKTTVVLCDRQLTMAFLGIFG